MARKTRTAPVKYHGGKWPLASKIIALMPPGHKVYVEAYAGGAAVLLQKPYEGTSEVLNDLDHRVANFWAVMRSPRLFERFQRRVQATEFGRRVFEAALAHEYGANRVRDAWAFFIVARQSLAGRQAQFAPTSKTRLRRNMNEQASAWWSAVDGLAQVHDRLRRVVVECRPAIEVIQREDSRQTLHYLDPPYLPSVRSVGPAYACDMTERDHEELLDTVLAVKGKVMLSGYPSRLYARRLKDWTVHTFDVANHAAGGARKRRMAESVWCNF